MTEAKFALSFDFTTIRGDSFDEFVDNCVSAFGEEDGKTVVAVAMSNLRNHFLGAPDINRAEDTVVGTLGAQRDNVESTHQNTQPARTGSVPQPGFSAAPTANSVSCKHGQMKFVPAGFSQKSQKNYAAFYVCQGPANDKCKSQN